MKALDDILRKNSPIDDAENTTDAELYAFTEAPKTYQPFIARPRPQMAFSVIEKGGTAHGFAYFTLRHPMHEVRGGEEFLSFASDGIAVVMQGSGLRAVFVGLLRHALIEVREYDGRPADGVKTMITRVVVSDPAEKQEPSLRLVKGQ